MIHQDRISNLMIKGKIYCVDQIKVFDALRNLCVQIRAKFNPGFQHHGQIDIGTMTKISLGSGAAQDHPIHFRKLTKNALQARDNLRF